MLGEGRESALHVVHDSADVIWVSVKLHLNLASEGKEAEADCSTSLSGTQTTAVPLLLHYDHKDI